MNYEELFKTKKQSMIPEKTRESRYMADSKEPIFKEDGSLIEKSYYDIINSPDLEHVENWRGSSGYIIFKVGSTYKALNGSTGAIDSSNASAHTVIQYAIDNTSKGKISVISDITLTSGITGAANIILDLHGHKVTPSTSFDIITMKEEFSIRNLVIDTSGITFTHSAIVFDGVDTYQVTDALTALQNIEVTSVSQQGTGIKFLTEADGEYIVWVSLHNIWLNFLEYGIRIVDTNSGTDHLSFINHNSFSNIFAHACSYGIHMAKDKGDINNNHFSGCHFSYAAGATQGFVVAGQHTVIMSDFSDYTVGAHALNITSGAVDTFFLGSGVENVMTNAGTGSTLLLVDSNTMEISIIRGNTDVDLNLDSQGTGTLVLNRLADGDVYLFSGSEAGDNKDVKIYGYHTGVGTKYLRLYVDTNGVANIYGQDSLNLWKINGLNYGAASNITCFAGSGSGVNREIKIKGRDAGNANTRELDLKWGDGTNDRGIISTDNGMIEIAPTAKGIILNAIKTDTGDPASPVNGQIYINNFDNKIRMYADGAWRDLATW